MGPRGSRPRADSGRTVMQGPCCNRFPSRRRRWSHHQPGWAGSRLAGRFVVFADMADHLTKPLLSFPCWRAEKQQKRGKEEGK